MNTAVRNGRSAWLWHEVPKENWRKALIDIQGAIGGILNQGSGELTVEGDPLALSLACYTSGTGPILGWWYERRMLGAAPEAASIVALHLEHSRRRANKLRANTIHLGRAFAERGIETSVLKGGHTANAYFPEPGTRPSADIDLLISPQDAKAAEATLRQQGYSVTARGPLESSWRHATDGGLPRSLWLSHADDPVPIDLHLSINVPLGPGLDAAILDDVGSTSKEQSWRLNPALKVLGHPVLLIYLAVHAGIALHNLTLLRLVELQFVIRRDQTSESLRWEEFLFVADEAGVLGHCYPALQMCEQLTPGIVPQTVLQQCLRQAPASVARILAELEPATAHRVDRTSLAEHFMWAANWRQRLQQLAADALATTSPSELWPIYRRRAWQIMRGTITLR